MIFEIKVRDPCIYCEHEREHNEYSVDSPPCNTCRANIHSMNMMVPRYPYNDNFKEKENTRLMK